MNAAQNLIDDQITGTTPMEARIARLESDVEHIKDVLGDIKLDVRGMQGELKAANDSIAALQKEVGVISATLPHLATKADLREVEGALNAQTKSVEGALNAQIKSVEGALNAQIKSVEGALNTKIHSVEGALKAEIRSVEGALNAKIHSFEGSLKAEVRSVEGALNAKINSVEGALTSQIKSVEGKISAMEARIIKWFIFTALGIGSLAFSIARFIR
jgi:chromosome segregation ATPase